MKMVVVVGGRLSKRLIGRVESCSVGGCAVVAFDIVVEVGRSRWCACVYMKRLTEVEWRGR